MFMYSWIKEIKLITWDLDGTLYPNSQEFSDEINRQKLEKVAKHLNCSIEEAKVTFDKIRSELGSHTKTLDELGLKGAKFFLNLWVEMSLEKYIKNNPQLVKIFSQVKFPSQAMLTNSNSRENIKRKLELIGLSSDHFDFIITSVEVGFNKPSPKIFEELIRRSRLKPNEIIYVGDRERMDIIPAKKLGMRTCMIGGESKEADISFKTPLELLAMFV